MRFPSQEGLFKVLAGYGKKLEIRDRLVHFELRDVHFPEPEELSMMLYGKKILQGRVVRLSTGVDADESFAEIVISGLPSPVYVRIDRIRVSA